jgi:hypothetical protein
MERYSLQSYSGQSNSVGKQNIWKIENFTADFILYENDECYQGKIFFDFALTDNDGNIKHFQSGINVPKMIFPKEKK